MPSLSVRPSQAFLISLSALAMLALHALISYDLQFVVPGTAKGLGIKSYEGLDIEPPTERAEPKDISDKATFDVSANVVMTNVNGYGSMVEKEMLQWLV